MYEIYNFSDLLYSILGYTFHHLSFGMACGNNLCVSRVVCNGFAFLRKDKRKKQKTKKALVFPTLV
jgi:hypothetical protein